MYNMASTKKVKGTVALASLILNMAIPGIGSLVAEKKNEGTWQLILLIIGALVSLTVAGAVIGIPLVIIAWIWSVLTAIKLVKQAD
ncbi:MAG: hypothetical protein PWQ28_92 [Candidatus Woesearchaeota archaeon]|nr:hypothetical protein [Candidatus Woesearchaeota archaeon]MDI3543811.1 hypothetical protein [Candidatus Woesearchaeota archaeon]MDK2907662.1 hypothetical protein [Candidatus Woesearchaeota archaeon]